MSEIKPHSSEMGCGPDICLENPIPTTPCRQATQEETTEYLKGLRNNHNISFTEEDVVGFIVKNKTGEEVFHKSLSTSVSDH